MHLIVFTSLSKVLVVVSKWVKCADYRPGVLKTWSWGPESWSWTIESWIQAWQTMGFSDISRRDQWYLSVCVLIGEGLSEAQKIQLALFLVRTITNSLRVSFSVQSQPAGQLTNGCLPWWRSFCICSHKDISTSLIKLWLTLTHRFLKVDLWLQQQNSGRL